MKNQVLTVLAALAMFGCTPEWARENDSDQVMHIIGIETDDGSILNSDICCPIVNDPAVVSIQLTRKNNTVAGTTLGDVYLSRYEVRYFRTDGRNVEGVDVPYRVTGPLAQNIHPASAGAHSDTSVTIDLVRHQAKLESPLANLRQFTVTDTGAFGSSGAGVLTVIAEVTVFGRQVNDRALSATGQVQINFANYGGDDNE
jgi:hypothetical protein